MEPLANARGPEGAFFTHRRSPDVSLGLSRDRDAVQFGPALSRDRKAVPPRSLLFNRRDQGAVKLS